MTQEEKQRALHEAMSLVYEEAKRWEHKVQALRCARSIDDPLARAVVAMNVAEKRLLG